MKTPKRVLIVGGVAGGASCAARLRRMDETAEITLIDRGPFVSFANCGLPYHVGDVIPDEADLLVATPELFRRRFNIEVKTQTEAVEIDREQKELRLRDLRAGDETSLPYDYLVLSPGAAPIRPPLPGIDLPGIFVVRTIPDSRHIRDWISERQARRAVVIGGGFIGLEMAENLRHRGLEVTIVEMLDQVMPPMDPEMVRPVEARLRKEGIQLALGDGVAGFEPGANQTLRVKTNSGAAYDADLVILSIGVRPETGLARAAGLEIGERGGIRVDDSMRTSDPSILAVGDAVEVRDHVTGQWTLIPLAGPANRQGRIAADVIAGREVKFRGVQATAICGVFDLAIASVGASEKALRRAGIDDFERIYLHPKHHAGYYPGAQSIHLKLLFRRSDGMILGAQAVGEEGVARRIDVISMAMQKGGTVYDLEEAELCYAPQYGSAKDPVNLAGMIAANTLRSDLTLGDWNATGGHTLLDVRNPDEFARGHVPGALNIPVDQLRDRLDDLPRDTELWLYCASGQRSYYATRLLKQLGFPVKSLPGGYETYTTLNGNGTAAAC